MTGADPYVAETPAYLYRLEKIRRAHTMLLSALPSPSRLYYSMKANPHPALVELLVERGCDLEICSAGELAIAVGAGVSPDRLLYTGPAKTDADVRTALSAGTRWFSADSPAGLEQLSRLAVERAVTVNCLLRVNDQDPAPGQGLRMTGVASQFGADLEWILREPKLFGSRDGLTMAGLHLYMGSNLSDEAALLTQFTTAIRTAKVIVGAVDWDLRLLNLGGGFGAPFARSGDIVAWRGLAGDVSRVLDEHFPGWRTEQPRIAFESGRYLTATCGTLVTRVLDVKQSLGRTVVILESGINHLGGMSGLRRLPQLVPQLQSRRSAGSVADAIVAGPLCTPLDAWARSAEIPELAAGDVVEVPNVGAYGITASLVAFLGHPCPAEVVIDEERVVEVSRLELTRQAVQPLMKEKSDG